MGDEYESLSMLFEYSAALCQFVELDVALVGHMPPKAYTFRWVSFELTRAENENDDARKLASGRELLDTEVEGLIDISLHRPAPTSWVSESLEGVNIQKDELFVHWPA